jgi:hypothetical protein
LVPRGILVGDPAPYNPTPLGLAILAGDNPCLVGDNIPATLLMLPRVLTPGCGELGRDDGGLVEAVGALEAGTFEAFRPPLVEVVAVGRLSAAA